MKRLFTLLFAATILFGCGGDYDDSSLTGRVDDLENRVAKLEELCKRMNTNISSLQTIVSVLQNKDYITNVTPITKEGEIIGYTISFAQAAPITIYNGQDGQDGQDGINGKDGITPVVGVKQDTDGIYYWTLNGGWLTDDSGNKIKAEGKDGQGGQTGADGITPKLKIENGYWYVSYNNGTSWSQLIKATGDKGDTGDSIFKTVEDNDDNVVFTLHDGTTITIPKVSPTIFDIVFDKPQNFYVESGKTYEIGYTIIGADNSTIVDVIAQDMYKATVIPIDYRTGTISIKTPTADLCRSKILVFISKGTSTIMRVLNVLEGVLIISDDTISAEFTGGTYETQVKTDLNYTVEVPTNDQTWISLAETRAIRQETLTFTLGPNTSEFPRHSTVNIKDGNGRIVYCILISQNTEYKTITIEPAESLSTIISAEDKNKITKLKLAGTLKPTDYEFLRSMSALKYLDLSQIEDTVLPAKCLEYTKIPTIILPRNLQEISQEAFQESAIASISFPASVTTIGMYAFDNCHELTGTLLLPEGLQTISQGVFRSCEKLTGELKIPDSVKELGSGAFVGCIGIESLKLGAGLTTISDSAFARTGLKGNLIIPDGIKTIGHSAFYNSTSLRGYLLLGKGIMSIEDDAFSHPAWAIDVGREIHEILPFAKIYIKNSTPPLQRGAFGDRGSLSTYIGVPIGAKSNYESNYNWHIDFTSFKEVNFDTIEL